MNRTESRRAPFAVVLLLTIFQLGGAERVKAEPARAPGSNVGDGTTAFTGLAQAPEANLLVGASSTSIPIVVPPGRKAMTPSLALSYSSAAGPSPYGYGWDLPLGRVQRSTKHGVLSCSDATYRNDFVLNLPGVAAECTLNAQDECVLWVQESFARVTYERSANTWHVWDKSGLHYVFAAPMGRDTSALFSSYPGGDCGYTFSWSLTKIEDTNQNSIEISYVDGGSAILYPDQVIYGGHNGADHIFAVDFVWSNEVGYSRPVEELNALGGFPARLTRLLSQLDVKAQGATVRSYSFQYEDQIVGQPERAGKKSFLSAVTLYNGAGQTLSRLDGGPTSSTFLYHENAPGFSGREMLVSSHPSAGDVARRTDDATDKTNRDLFDITGDGIADWVDAFYVTGPDQPPCVQNQVIPVPTGQRVWCVYPGLPGGGFGTTKPWLVPDVAYGTIRDVDIPDNTVTSLDTFDINGDGVPDFVDARTVENRGPVWKVHLGQPAVALAHGRFATDSIDWPAPYPHVRESYSRAFAAPPGFTQFGGTADKQDVIDMNGDGLPDLVRADSTDWRIWFNTGAGFASQEATFPAPEGFLRFSGELYKIWSHEPLPGTPDGWPTTHFGIFDMNGDALPDVVDTFDGTLRVYPNLGRQFGDSEDWPVPDVTCGNRVHWGIREESKSQQRVHRDLFDVNGDGLPDSVTACGTAWIVYFNRGAGFSQTPVTWTNAPGWIRDTGLNISHDTFDADGDGMVDFVDFALAAGVSPAI